MDELVRSYRSYPLAWAAGGVERVKIVAYDFGERP